MVENLLQASFENHDDMQLKRLADYFGRAFTGVNSAQFPWVKMFRESPVSKIVDVSELDLIAS